MAIFRIRTSDSNQRLLETWNMSKVILLPVLYTGKIVGDINKYVFKDKKVEKNFINSTVGNRATGKKREEAINSVKEVQLNKDNIKVHLFGSRYIVYLTIGKNKAMLSSTENSISVMLDKLKEIPSVSIAVPLFKDGFHDLDIKKVLDIFIKYNDLYPAYIDLYVHQDDLKSIERVLKKHDIVYDLKTIKE